MQSARNTLRHIYANTVSRSAGEDAPLLAWPVACGGRIARRTVAVSYRDGELAVRVPDKIWSRQLQQFCPQYVAALNELSRQKVKSIRFLAPD